MSNVIEEVIMNEWAYHVINNPEKYGASKSEFERAIDTDLAYKLINKYKISGGETENGRTN